MRVYDEQGQKRDREWLATMFGPQVRVDTSQGSPAFHVVELRASTSKAATVTVLEANGNPLPGITVVYAHKGGNPRVREKTDQNGQITVPLVEVFRYGVPANEGPCHAGIPGEHTDVIHGLGEVLVGGGDNRHLDITFQRQSQAPGPGPSPTWPPSPTTEGHWQQLLEKLDTIIELLRNDQA
jgi:hypothetical protein